MDAFYCPYHQIVHTVLFPSLDLYYDLAILRCCVCLSVYTCYYIHLYLSSFSDGNVLMYVRVCVCVCINDAVYSAASV